MDKKEYHWKCLPRETSTSFSIIRSKPNSIHRIANVLILVQKLCSIWSANSTCPSNVKYGDNFWAYQRTQRIAVLPCDAVQYVILLSNRWNQNTVGWLSTYRFRFPNFFLRSPCPFFFSLSVNIKGIGVLLKEFTDVDLLVFTFIEVINHRYVDAVS